MPYIQGETIREKLNRETQFGVDEAVRIAREVADALDYAHRHGVIHRDIKPENILLHDGRAMVMDFGIALAVCAAAGGRMTETGLSLGTPHYMIARAGDGGEGDHAAERHLLARERAVRNARRAAAAHRRRGAAGDHEDHHRAGAAGAQLRKNVPANVDAALAKALEKLPADRFESAKAFGDALANATYSLPSAVEAAWRRWGCRAGADAAIPALALSVVLVATTAWALLRSRAGAPFALSVELPDGKRLGATQWSPMAVSPDGSKLVYVGETGRLLVRSRDQLDPVELAGTEGAFNPFFSPDGLRVGFMSGAPGSSEIKVSSLGGGPPITVTQRASAVRVPRGDTTATSTSTRAESARCDECARRAAASRKTSRSAIPRAANSSTTGPILCPTGAAC